MKRIVVISVLFAALAGEWSWLYLRGLSYGEPFPLQPDEPKFVYRALSALRTGDFNPHFFEYPSFWYYNQVAVSVVTHLYLVLAGKYGDHELREVGDITYRERFHFIVAGRLLSAGFAAATGAVVFLLARLLAGPLWAGLAAAVCLAHLLMVQNGHWAMTDMPGNFLCAAAIYSSVRFVSDRKLWRLAWGALLAGLAAGTKYNLMIVVVTPLAAGFLAEGGAKGRRLAAVLLLSMVGFLCSTPYALLDLPNFLNGFCWQMHHYRWSGSIGATAPFPLMFYLRSLWNSGWAFFACSLLGCVLLLIRFGAPGLVVLSFPLVYSLFLLRFRVTVARNLLCIVPVLAVGLAVGLAWLERLLGRTGPRRGLSSSRFFARFATGLLGAGIMVQVLSYGLAWVSRLQMRNVIQNAQEWIEQNLPAGSRIVTEQMGEVVLPIPDERFSVRTSPGVYFSRPYIYCLIPQEDYLVSPFSAAYDEKPWVRDQIVRGLESRMPYGNRRLISEYLRSNRDRFDARFRLVNCLSASPSVEGDIVSVFQVPRLKTEAIPGPVFIPDESISSRLAGAKSLLKDYFPFCWNGRISVSRELAAGEYDVFIEARANYRKRNFAPELEVCLGEGPGQRVKVIFNDREFYVCTFRVKTAGEHRLSIGFFNDQGVGHDVFLYQVILVTRSGTE